jgi:formylglycine-generating enzyme required for sulfatase activity
VSDDSQVTCPECQTTQSAKAPFCENCGYRIRRSDTVKEGHQVVTDEMLQRLRRSRTGQDPSQTGRQMGQTANDGGAPFTGAGRSAAGRASQMSSPEEPQTQIEGLQAVGSADISAETPAAAHSAELSAATSQSALMERPAPDAGGSKMAIYVTIWLSLTAVAVLATYFLATRLPDDASADAVEVPEKVDIPEGPFLRGLEEDVRSFILQMCQKVEDDPRETCKQDKLLAGEFPEKTVELAAYEIDATETTVGEYQACVDADGCEPIDYKACEVWTHQGLQISLRVPKALQEPNMPVTCVSQAQAKAYCKWAGGKLPSSDQWEKAARGDKGKLFPWGTSWSSDIANWGEMDIAKNPIVGKLDGYEWTAPPASFPKGKSPYGVYDMAGNVAEWVDNGEKLELDARGGSWTSHPFDLRVTSRMELEPDDTRTDVGFRCVY